MAVAVSNGSHSLASIHHHGTGVYAHVTSGSPRSPRELKTGGNSFKGGHVGSGPAAGYCRLFRWLCLVIAAILFLVLWPYVQCVSAVIYNYIFWVVASGGVQYAAVDGSSRLGSSSSSSGIVLDSQGVALARTTVGGAGYNGVASGSVAAASASGSRSRAGAGTSDVSGSYTPVNEALLVPKVLHQTWRTTVLPEKWQAAQASCKAMHADWEYKLWTDEDGLELIRTKFPDFLPTYLSYEFDIQRVDALRYFILYSEGGVYLDLDIICKQPLDFLRRYSFMAPKTYPTGISNDVLSAAPGDAFARMLTEQLPHWNRWFVFKYITVMFTTGPMFVSVQYSRYTAEGRRHVAVLPPALYGKYDKNSTQSLFEHLHGSSWHGKDARMVFWFERHGMFAGAALALTVIAVLGYFVVLKMQQQAVLKGVSLQMQRMCSAGEAGTLLPVSIKSSKHDTQHGHRSAE